MVFLTNARKVRDGRRSRGGDDMKNPQVRIAIVSFLGSRDLGRSRCAYAGMATVLVMIDPMSEQYSGVVTECSALPSSGEISGARPRCDIGGGGDSR